MRFVEGHRAMTDLISILLVDDDIVDVENVRRSLMAVEPPIFKLEHVGTFRQALQRVGQVNFHVVMLDLGLPDSVGLHGLERLMVAIPSIPVIVLTGSMDDALALRAIELGAQEFISKQQISSQELVRAIRHAAKRKQYTLNAGSKDPKTAQLETIIRETAEVVCSRVDRLKETELTVHQTDLLLEIEDKSKSSMTMANLSSLDLGRTDRRDDDDIIYMPED